MTNDLSQARADVAEALSAAGIKSIDYVQEAFTPPIAVVLPDQPYVSAPVGQNPFHKPYSINLQVMVIGAKGTNKAAATQIDSMLVRAVNALEDDWDITEVGAPTEVSLKGVSYFGALITLQTNTTLKEVI